MPNIEIKAKCSDLNFARELAQSRHTDYLGSLHQVDTYYETKTGRLKIREINGKEAQLIPYKKDYSTGPMKSDYTLLPVQEPENTKAILANILGEIAVVDKEREVFLIENIRVHLDTVKNLGSFIEFEAVYSDESERENEIQKVNELIKEFKISKEELLDKSYVDFLL